MQWGTRCVRALRQLAPGLCCHLEVHLTSSSHFLLAQPKLGVCCAQAQAQSQSAHLRLRTRAVAAAVRKRAAAEPRKTPKAAAVGPQHSPSLPSSKPAPAPGPPQHASPVGSEGDWAGRGRQAQAGRLGRRNGTASVCRDVSDGVQAVGRCQDVCDQLYDTCPNPVDLPRGTPPPRGGPVGWDPPKKPPYTMTAADMRTAVDRGALRMPTTAATQQANSTRHETLHEKLRKAVAHLSEPWLKGLLAGDHAAALASRAATPGTSTSGMNATRAARAEQGLIINTGDSWAIRNDNCELAPIHGIVNRVGHVPTSCQCGRKLQRCANCLPQ